MWVHVGVAPCLNLALVLPRPPAGDYTIFGQVVTGFDVVDAINALSKGGWLLGCLAGLVE